MTVSLGLTPEQMLERRRAQNKATRGRELPTVKAARLAKRREREAAQRHALPRKVRVYIKHVPTQEQLERRRALSKARQRAYDKRRREEARAARAAMPKLPKLQASKKRSVDKRIACSANALQEWKQNGYQPNAYVVPPPGQHYALDKRWWASLSHGEQVKILSMRTPDMARKYAAESKRQFVDGNSVGNHGSL
jgi:hypothetical protein